MFVNNSCAYISKSKRCFNAKFSTYFFHMNRKILADFQIFISVPQGFGREKDENRVDLCLRSIVLSFESGRL